MDLNVPDVRIAGADDIGHFRSAQAFAHFLRHYRACCAAMPQIAEIHDVPTGFGTVRIYRFAGGAGTPMLLLPGRNGPTPVYGTNLPPLLQHRDVYCLDLLGEPGLSVQTAPIVDAADQACWLDQALAGLGLERLHLCGISIGGWAAVNYAVRCPGRAATLVLLDPAMTFDRIPVPMLAASIPMVVPGVPHWVRRRLLSWIAGGSDIGEAAPAADLISAATNDFVLRLPAPTRFTDAQLRGLDIPVLALLGGRSVVVRAERAASNARKLLRKGEIEVWPDASHAINGEYPCQIAERARRFWSDAG
ncbi:alpha/beta hydrolase [Mycobacterium sp. MS1601]|nr:alpha/beta hydrolase [Mycobacterium sp. MS1601]